MKIRFYAHASFRLEVDGFAVITDHYTPGPQYWMVPDGRTLSQMARTLDQDLAEEA